MTALSCTQNTVIINKKGVQYPIEPLVLQINAPIFSKKREKYLDKFIYYSSLLPRARDQK